jgi:DNA-binding MarR family transcriptional regulator
MTTLTSPCQLANMMSKLDKTVAHSIRDLVTKMNRRLRKQMSNPEQMSVTELNVLYLLIGSEQLSPSGLCEQLNISSQYMSQVLNRLEELKYVSRQASLKDKRKSVVSLTTKGKAKIQDSRQEREEWLAGAVAQHFTAADKQIIQKAIKLLLILPDL